MPRRRSQGSGTITPIRPGVWRLRVYVGQDPITSRPRQVSRTVHFKGARQANQALAQFVHEVSEGKFGGTSATVRVVLDEYLGQMDARGLAPTTQELARQIVAQRLAPTLGSLRVCDLKARDIERLYARYISEGVSPVTVRRYHAILSGALAQAVRWGWIDKNPARDARPPTLPPRTLDLPTEEQVRTLYAAASAKNDRYGAIVAIATFTGARRGEICGLRWHDVDLGAGVLRLRRSIYQANGRSGEKLPKSGRERHVTLGPVGTAFLKRWRERCEEVAAEGHIALHPTGYVVPGDPDGSRPMHPDTVSTVICKLAKDLGMANVNLHSLRHYAATEMLGSGISPQDAADLLGHSSTSVTLNVYAHATAERQRQAVAVLERAMPPLDEQKPRSPAEAE